MKWACEWKPSLHTSTCLCVSGCRRGDIGFRTNIVNEVEKLVEFFVKEVGTDLLTRTESNAFWSAA
jgi:hypothetical protein